MQSIENVPTWFADTWDIPLEAAQVILSVIVILAVLLPVLIVTKGKGMLIPAVMFILAEAILVGVSWLPAWVMIMTVVVIALIFARTTSTFTTGG